MRRRLFIQGALFSLVIPGHTLAVMATPPETVIGDADYFFYDERFPEARQMAREMGNAARLIAVQADMTRIWHEQVRPACGNTSLILAGVTTESFHFCLRHMVNSVTHMNSTVTRVGRDLHLWHIRTRNDQKRLTGI